MNEVEIEKTLNYDELWELFLLADPSKSVVQEYLSGSEVYIARINGSAVGAYILFKHSATEYEIKNIAVSPEFQKKGVGSLMLKHAKSLFTLESQINLKICTGNTSEHQIALYEKSGFRIVSIEKGFFVKNYPEPIYENGVRCEDLIVMSQKIG